MAAPDSPRSSQSPPPVGRQGDLELELLGLANALYNLGTTVVNDSTKEREKGGVKQVGLRVNDVVNHLSAIDDMAQDIRTMIPLQVLTDIDNAKNPMQLTKEQIERAATENQFMNAKVAALASYRTMLNEALAQHFPDLEGHINPRPEPSG
ncbi:hypothetical protein CC1G_00467 [Coprinopsis cinerea okayama7|uniref:Mediator of RNA polymerase II transcription subunit 10 n=1 Tax=Coprinopsis cinerea (strain Okayama-7 / 130 / ATCC MYA-4618 / FGSC 9003) TaxID=240176 RepID=A8NY15_COPC7|nr:hypothetical protein CC1G_00467 [Coprinopsis cinerea okayama7\|eukprot:XP_001837331.1 hypothetical protein CC1G_00467 [Coprinopsis cinerea okayama7\